MMDPAREAAVWARVRGEQPQAQPQEPTASPWSAETAAALYQAEAAAAYTYQRLAGRCVRNFFCSDSIVKVLTAFQKSRFVIEV